MVIDHICVNFGAKLFHELVLELNAFKVEQNVFYPRNNKHRIVDPGEIYHLDSPLILNRLTRAFFPGKRRIMQQHYDPLFHRNKPDLIHAHTLFSDGSLANYYYLKHNTPFIVAIRSTDLDVFLRYRPWLRHFGKQVLENASNIVFISPSLRIKFQKIFGDRYDSKSLVIPNGINQSYFSIDEQIKKELHKPVELLYVGSFLKRKNVPALIKLVEISNTRLSIVGGGGNEKGKVLQMIRHCDKVNYLGQVDDQNKLSEIYRKSDIFIMTSSAETFGLVYIEAMSQGLPLVYSRDTGIDGYFEQGTVGFGVKPGSVSEMKKAINNIASNYQEISMNCMTEARKLNWAEIAKKYYDIYKRIISD